MQASKTKMLNGVDIKRLEGTIAAVTENPAIADFKLALLTNGSPAVTTALASRASMAPARKMTPAPKLS